jgi:hypothetical protein
MLGTLPPVVRGFDYVLALDVAIDGVGSGAGWSVDADLFTLELAGVGSVIASGLMSWADQASGVARLHIPAAVTAALAADVKRVATRPALISPTAERIPLDLIALDVESGANVA